MLLGPDAEPANASARDGDPEALIPEARRRARRRRVRRGLVAAAGAGLLVVALLARGGGGERALGETRGRPFVNARAFAGQGELAFVSRGRLWVLDGDTGTLRRLPAPAGYTASSPGFSRDGRWLAYLVSRGPATYASRIRLWLARANGTSAHAVRGLSVDQLVGWSDAGDVLAVTAGRLVHLAFGWSSTTTDLDLVTPPGRTRRLFAVAPSAAARAESISAAVWSPDGEAIAVSTYAPAESAGTIVRTIPLADPRHPTTWFAIHNSQRLAGICPPGCVPNAVIADLAGWWPRWGIAFWVFSSGAVHNSDSTPLALIARPGARPRVIAQTLSDRVTDAIATGAAGALAVVASSTNAGRQLAEGKLVETCRTATPACVALRGASVWAGPALRAPDHAPAPRRGAPGSGVSLDPSWSPNGELLAYVKAPADFATAVPGAAWYADHALYLWNRHTSVIRRLGSADGAALPTWSRTGRELLYVAGDGLWLVRLNGGEPIEIARPLFPEREWQRLGPADEGNLAFYGQIPWGAQFSWNSP